MQIITYGGSFNPLTNAHLEVAKLALSHCSKYDTSILYWVPTDAHAFNKTLADYTKRKAIIDRAITDIPNMYTYSMIPPKYHWTLMCNIKRAHPPDEHLILIGSDVLKDLTKWYNYGKLNHEFKFLIVVRNNDDLNYLSKLKKYAIIGSTKCKISSTEVRGLIKNGKSIKDLVPNCVHDDIVRMWGTN